MKKLFRCLAILIVLTSMTIIAGCSKSASGSIKMSNNAPAYNSVMGTQNKTAATDNKASSGSTSSKSSNSLQAADNRKIIQSGNISLQTTTYDKATAGIEALVSQYGGFVQNSTTQGTGQSGNSRTASYTIRIPAAKLDTFLGGVGDFGKVISKSKTGQDVTQNYYDTDAHLTTLKAEKERILDILSKTQNMTDLLTIEQRLTEVDNQIEQLTGELQKMDSLIDMSTVTINISEVVEITNTPNSFFGQIGSVLSGSVKALLTTFKYIAIVLIAVLPFAVVFGGIGAAIFFIRRRRLKNNKAAKPEEHSES